MRGPLSATAAALLRGESAMHPVIDVADPLSDDDLQLALFLCYEVHYGPLDGASELAEWDPRVLGFRLALERRFEDGLRAAAVVTPTAEPVDVQLRRQIDADASPSVSSFLAREGTAATYREFLMHRSVYHLREADPHTFAIPRLRGRAKAAMVEIQSDEYGGGDNRWMHSALFAQTMREMGLDTDEGAYVDRLPGVTLASMNLMSLFGLHRRLRGAAVGHLAVFEMTSCIPNRRYGDGLRRLGFGPAATAYFDEHVEADAAHGAIAANDMAGSLVQDDHAMLRDVLFGASALLIIERRWAEHVLPAWRAGGDALWSERSREAAAAVA